MQIFHKKDMGEMKGLDHARSDDRVLKGKCNKCGEEAYFDDNFYKRGENENYKLKTHFKVD